MHAGTDTANRTAAGGSSGRGLQRSDSLNSLESMSSIGSFDSISSLDSMSSFGSHGSRGSRGSRGSHHRRHGGCAAASQLLENEQQHRVSAPGLRITTAETAGRTLAISPQHALLKVTGVNHMCASEVS